MRRPLLKFDSHIGAAQIPLALWTAVGAYLEEIGAAPYTLVSVRDVGVEGRECGAVLEIGSIRSHLSFNADDFTEKEKPPVNELEKRGDLSTLLISFRSDAEVYVNGARIDSVTYTVYPDGHAEIDIVGPGA